jgi:hypothetical protein
MLALSECGSEPHSLGEGRMTRPPALPFIRRAERRGEKRRATIQAYIAAERLRGHSVPTIEDVAKLFAISRARVEFHYRALGLAK